MNLLYFLIVLISINLVNSQNKYESDNEFAEFEDFDVDEEVLSKSSSESTLNDQNVNASPNENLNIEQSYQSEENSEVLAEIEEFDSFNDEDEFEGLDSKIDDKLRKDSGGEPKITIQDVPLPFRSDWESYWLEILMTAGIVIYFINFFTGKTKNTKIANVWLSTHKSLLEDNFCLIGDDGKLEAEIVNGYIKESENQFTLWCSGRTCCEGMLVELKLIKRQDLVALMSGLVKPTLDQLHIKVIMNKEDMDGFVFCLATKKTSIYLQKEMADLSIFCGERRQGEKFGLTNSLWVLSEMPEVASAMLDSRVQTFLCKYSHMIEYIHFSDQYSGIKQPDDGSTHLELPETQKVLLFGFNIPIKGQPLNEAMENAKPLLQFVFYCIEKIKRFKLSKEGKAKSDKNRAKVEEAFLRNTWQARAEAAQQRRDDRKRAEREKMLADADPERQRRWEEKEQKRQAKKRAPKLKQLKVKAL